MSARDLDTRIDWFRVMADLNRAGYSTRAFADSLGIARTTIQGWKSGAEPKHADGERLLSWWSHVTGRPVDAAPREPRLSGIRPAPTSNMRPVPIQSPSVEAYDMPRGIPRTPRTVQTPGEPLAPAAAAATTETAQDDAVNAVEAENFAEQVTEQTTETATTETAQEAANRTGRPQLCPRQGWVLPESAPANLERAGGR